MKFFLACVHDMLSDSHGFPFVAGNSDVPRESTLRDVVFGFKDAHPDHPVRRYPADHRILLLGTFDSDTGELVSLPRPELLITGSDLIAQCDKFFRPVEARYGQAAQ